jgi:hypothetical protein
MSPRPVLGHVEKEIYVLKILLTLLKSKAIPVTDREGI